MDTFLSTPSARRATPPAAAPVSSMSDFYPRPPRGGRPLRPAPQPAYRSHFYPRPPRGGRQRGGAVLRLGDKFLSTPSARRATGEPGTGVVQRGISIHALREEGDYVPGSPPAGARRFLSTPSARRATNLRHNRKLLENISIHALREEGDVTQAIRGQWPTYFYPRPPRGGRQQKQRQNLYFQTNYTTFCTNLEEP